MRGSRSIAIVSLSILAASAVLPAASWSATSDGSDLRQQVKDHIGDVGKLSLGARAWLDSAQFSSQQQLSVASSTPSFGTNVDANDPDKDLAGGQSETAIAASSGRVLAAWNDLTGFLITDSTRRRGSLTGVGYSNNGGRSFTDLLGLPNNNPDQQWAGDPTVVAVDSRHFIVGSLYFPSFGACVDPSSGELTGRPAGLNLAVSVATVNATGDSVSFTNPIKAARGGDVCKLFTPPTPSDIALLDKEFLSYDPASRTLAMSYTRFFLGLGGQSQLGQIEVVRAKVPADPGSLTSGDFGKPIVVWGEESICTDSSATKQCGAFNTGAYPSVAPGGDTYVAWERNWLSNLPFCQCFSGDPYVYIHAAVVPSGVRSPTVGGKTKPKVITKGQAYGNQYGGVRSMDGALIAGYSRGLGNDFPRIAVNPRRRAVEFVWNDASHHQLGDVWLREVPYGLRLQGTEIRRVNDKGDYTLHFLPAVSVGADGSINTSWYDRRRWGPDSAKTDYYGETRQTPTTQASDYRISTGATDWTNTSSFFFGPNFGDYTDNATDGTTTYFTWTDGRIGVPQPFVDSH